MYGSQMRIYKHTKESVVYISIGEGEKDRKEEKKEKKRKSTLNTQHKYIYIYNLC